MRRPLLAPGRSGLIARPALVSALLRRGIARVEPIIWAGPFPDQMLVNFRA